MTGEGTCGYVPEMCFAGSLPYGGFLLTRVMRAENQSQESACAVYAGRVSTFSKQFADRLIVVDPLDRFGQQRGDG